MRFCLVACCYMLLAFTLPAQKVDFDLSVLTVPPALQDGAKSIIRYYDHHYQAHSDRSATVSVKKAVTIFDEEIDENELSIHYDNDVKIIRFKATIYDAMGKKVREAAKSDFEDVMAISNGQFYVDSRVKTITLEHASLPFTVVFEYELKLNDFGMIRFPRWVPRGFEQSCQQASFTAVVPNDNELLYDVHELDEPVVKRDDKVTTYRWAVENLPAIKWEPFRPVFAKVLPNVQAQLRRFKISDKHVGSYGSWKDFGQLIVELCKDRDELPASLKAEI
ncbi:MAG: DUF3857 domain-containing protein, partial [Bacteroidota bacterium]